MNVLESWLALLRTKAAWYYTRFLSFVTTPPRLLLSPWYTYRPLGLGQSTRLLHLYPGAGPLRMALKIVDLDDPSEAQYEAISYAWGDASLTESVYCDGSRLDIPASLHAALYHLRPAVGSLDEDAPAASPRVLWADAICINQRDVLEKNHQVALMHRIYAKPTGVLIWTGADTEGLQGVAESIDHVRTLLPRETYDAQELVTNSQEYYHKLSNLRIEGRLAEHFHYHDWTPINDLLCRPWFDRKWIIQEVLMAPDSVPRTLISGNLELPWESLSSMGYVMASYGLIISACGLSLLYGYPEKVASFYKSDLRPSMMLFNAQMIKIIQYYRGQGTLLDCVIATGMFASTDPRDKVYALLSLGTHHPDFKADYRLSIEEVCTQFATSTLVQDQNLKCLSIAPHRTIGPQAGGFPSWVPNIAMPTIIEPLAGYSIRAPLFSAGIANPDHPLTYKVATSADGKVLHLRGRIVDTIGDFGTCLLTTPIPEEEDIAPKTGYISRQRAKFRNWFRECQELAFPVCAPALPEAECLEATAVNPAVAAAVVAAAHPIPLTPQQVHYRSQPLEQRRKFALTLLCGSVGMRDPVPPVVLDTCIEYMDFITDVLSSPPSYIWRNERPELRDRLVTHSGLIETSLNGMVAGRKFATTAGGRWAEVRLEAEKEDLICVISGAEAPFVLRPVFGDDENEDEVALDRGTEEAGQEPGPTTRTSKRQRYTLIGECYLTDMMHGEALTDDRYPEIEIDLV